MKSLKTHIKELLIQPRASLGVIQGVRPFRKGLHGKCISFHWSLKNGRFLMPCEGRLERAHALLMEFDNEIKAFYLQPMTIAFDDGGSYTPDAMLVHFVDRITFRQVKPAGQLESITVKQRMKRASRYIEAHGFQHEILTELDLSPEHAHLNREFIYANIKIPVTPWELSQARELFPSGFKASITDCYSILQSNDLPFQIVEHLLLEQWFKYEERFTLNTKSLLEVTQ